MPMILEIVTGPFTGKKLEISEGKPLRVGRTTKADFSLPHDDFMSSLHFSVAFEADLWILRDLNSSNGTLLNRNRIQEAALKSGDMIVAGDTCFSVSLPAMAASAGVPSGYGPAPSISSSLERTQVRGPGSSTLFATSAELLPLLASSPEPLFGLLDAARDFRVLHLLRSSGDLYQSLYEGEKAEEWASIAPYLVHLPKTSALLPKLVEASHGQSWGIFLTSLESFQGIRKHFRRFLTTSAPDGRKLYFRFYDPRVLRVYLPTCTADERKEFFGPVSCFFAEGEKPDELLLFSSAIAP